jgi:hypothetical protein
VDDFQEQLYEGQENRARILFALGAKGLPVDVSITLFKSRNRVAAALLCLSD